MGLLIAGVLLAVSLCACQSTGDEGHSEASSMPEMLSFVGEASPKPESLKPEESPSPSLEPESSNQEVSSPPSLEAEEIMLPKDFSDKPVVFGDWGEEGPELAKRYSNEVPEHLKKAVRKIAQDELEWLFLEHPFEEPEFPSDPPLDYDCGELSVYEIAEDENSLCFGMSYVFKPRREGEELPWLAGNGHEDEEREGYFRNGRGFLIKKEYGLWHIEKSGGGVHLDSFFEDSSVPETSSSAGEASPKPEQSPSPRPKPEEMMLPKDFRDKPVVFGDWGEDGPELAKRYSNEVPEHLKKGVRKVAQDWLEWAFLEWPFEEPDFPSDPPLDYDCGDLMIYEISEDETSLCFGMSYVFKPQGEGEESPWLAGNGYEDEEREGYFRNGRSFRLKKTCGLWYIDNCGTGGVHLEGFYTD